MMTRGKKPKGLIHPKSTMYKKHPLRPTVSGVSKTK